MLGSHDPLLVLLRRIAAVVDGETGLGLLRSAAHKAPVSHAFTQWYM